MRACGFLVVAVIGVVSTSAIAQDGLGSGTLEQIQPIATWGAGDATLSFGVGWGLSQWEIGNADFATESFVARGMASWWISDRGVVAIDLCYAGGSDEDNDYGDSDFSALAAGLSTRLYLARKGAPVLPYLGVGIDYTLFDITMDMTRNEIGEFVSADMDAEWAVGAKFESGIQVPVSDSSLLGLGVVFSSTLGADVEVNGNDEDAELQTVALMVSFSMDL